MFTSRREVDHCFSSVYLLIDALIQNLTLSNHICKHTKSQETFQGFLYQSFQRQDQFQIKYLYIYYTLILQQSV